MITTGRLVRHIECMLDLYDRICDETTKLRQAEANGLIQEAKESENDYDMMYEDYESMATELKRLVAQVNAPLTSSGPGTFGLMLHVKLPDGRLCGLYSGCFNGNVSGNVERMYPYVLKIIDLGD